MSTAHLTGVWAEESAVDTGAGVAGWAVAEPVEEVEETAEVTTEDASIFLELCDK